MVMYSGEMKWLILSLCLSFTLAQDADDCYTGLVPKRQTDYRGTRHTTQGGIECQAWSSQTPQSHSRTPERNPYAGLDANYCRNPDNEDAAWCYTTDTKKRWDYCGIESCTDTKSVYNQGCIQEETDLLSGDIRSFKTTGLNLTQCVESCLNDWACKAFTYTNNNGYCYLKSAEHKNGSVCERCVSGRAECFVDHKRYTPRNTLVNVALNDGVEISATRENSGGVAERAIDNSTNTFWDERSCTKSSTSGMNYLELDLDQVYQIDHIMLYTRADEEQDQLNGAKLFIGSQLCETLSNMEISPGHGHKITCGDDPTKRVGKMVWIERLGSTIIVCELQVWVDPKVDQDEVATQETILHDPQEVDGFYNVAYRKTATESSQHGSSTAGKAVDGYVNQVYDSGSSGSCSCTNNRAKPETWQVDLGRVYQIDHIRVYGRTDRDPERLDGVRVLIGSSICGTLTGKKTAGEYDEVQCDSEYMAGRYVKLLNHKEYLTLCEIQVMVKKADIDVVPTVQVYPGEKVGEYTNVAIFKTTSQSTELHGGAGKYAVDGESSGQWSDGSCTHTNKDGNSQWMVDLGTSYIIDHVILYGRTDCCSERLEGARVRVGRDIVGYVTVPEESSDPMTISVTNATSEVSGRRVYVDLLHEYMILCEVQVMVKNENLFEETATELPDWENVALDKNTTQSSERHGGDSSRGVDGWPDATTWGEGSCTHSDNEALNWWEVDLGKKYYIDHIKLIGRSDGSQYRLEHAVVMVDGAVVSGLNYKDDQHVFELPMHNLHGRRVRVRVRNEYLTVCELQVMVNNKYEPEDTEEDPLKNGKTNLAANGQVSTAKYIFGGSPDLAIDGDTDADFFGGSCTFSGPAQGANWWQVELEDTEKVGMVYVYPRLDSYTAETIAGATVRVGDHTCGSIEYVKNKRLYSINCNQAKGSTVSISKVGWLSICEVVVNN